MTSSDHLAHVRTLIAREVPASDDKPAVDGWLQRVCRSAARDLPAMGVGISLLPQDSAPLSVAASSESLAVVEELQFVLGEGPCIDAHALRRPVLAPDLGAAEATTTWPGYAPAAQSHGVRAVFAFPMHAGAARLGAMDVYRDRTGGLSQDALSRALTFAEVAMERLLLDADIGDQGAVDVLDDLDGHRFEVYQAQGMVMAQLHIGADQALIRMRAFAFAHERRVADVARDIVARKIELEPDA